MALLVITAYSTQPANNGVGDGTQSGCSCHGSNSSSTAIELKMVDSATGLAVSGTEYIAGRTYILQLVGTSANPDHTQFGFQISAKRGASGNVNAGTFLADASNTHRYSSSGEEGIEHTAPIAAIDDTFQTTCRWVAPAPGTGPIRLTVALNAVNANQSTTGDQPNIASFPLNEAPGLGLNHISCVSKLTISPNPAQDVIRLRADCWPRGNYRVQLFNLNGQLVLCKAIPFGAASAEAVLPLPVLPAGLYILHVDGVKRIAAAVVVAGRHH